MYIARFSPLTHKEEALIDHLRKVAKFAGDFGEKMGLKKTGELMGKLHDIGKYGDPFLHKIKNAEENAQEFDSEVTDTTKVDHGVYGAKYIYEKFRTDTNKPYADMLIVVLCYHHGGLPDCVLADDYDVSPVIKRIKEADEKTYCQVVERFEEENTQDIAALFEASLEELRALGSKIVALNKEMVARFSPSENTNHNVPKTNATKFFYIQLLIKTLYSILIDADRLDSYLFEADIAFEKTDTTRLWKRCKKKLEDKVDFFSNLAYESENEKKVAQMRSYVSESCSLRATKEPGIYRLWVPTGGAKTLGAFRFAFNHAILHNMERIVYVAPYKTIIEQNAKSIRDVLKEDRAILEFHSDITENSDSEHYRIVSERFDSPIIFTSMVQFLNVFYAGGTKSLRRAHHFANSILIFDEVQSLPIKCISLFNEAINYLSGVLGSTVILSTATQPRQDIFTHPAKLSSNCELVEGTPLMEEASKRVTLEDKRIEGGYTFEQAASFVKEIKKHNTSVLVVANTVRSAGNIFECLKDNTPQETKLFYLSAHMCPAHRKKKIEELKIALKNKIPLICVSTQLIEAGVDISFCSAVRCLAGMDSIVQTLGRVNRNAESTMATSYLINVQNDGTENLSEIRLGATVSQMLLNNYAKNPEKYDNNNLGTKMLNDYYGYYYNDQMVRDASEYAIDENVTMFDLLQCPTARTNKDISFNYLFKTAGGNFSAIDSKTVGVLVPYKDGKELCEQFLGTKSLIEKKKLLKLLQQYTVNISTHFISKEEIKNLFVPIEEGIYMAKASAYSDEKGMMLYSRDSFLNA